MSWPGIKLFVQDSKTARYVPSAANGRLGVLTSFVDCVAIETVALRQCCHVAPNEQGVTVQQSKFWLGQEAHAEISVISGRS